MRVVGDQDASESGHRRAGKLVPDSSTENVPTPGLAELVQMSLVVAVIRSLPRSCALIMAAIELMIVVVMISSRVHNAS